MSRLMLATIAAAVLAFPTLSHAQSTVKQPPEAMPQQKKMQSQRDWTPQQKAERPPSHQGEEQKFGAGQDSAGQDSTVGQSSSPASEAAKPIPEHEIKPPEGNSGK